MSNRQKNQQHGQQLITVTDRGSFEQLFLFLQAFHRQPFQSLTDALSYQGVIDDQIDFIDWTGTRYNVTPLIIAAGKGSYEKAKILLVHGANPNKQCSTGDTALNLAAHRQKYPIVDLLLQYHANPNYSNQSGKTALHRAAVAYSSEGIKHIRTLLNAGADPTIEDRNQRSPLDEAVLANKPAIVETLLSHHHALVQQACRAAIISSRLGYDQCLITLLNHGMDPNVTDRTRTAPLHVAVRSLQLPIVRILIAHGADQNLANNRGETPLSIAELLPSEQQRSFVNVLVETPQTVPSKLRTHPPDNNTDAGFHRTILTNCCYENTTASVYPLLRNRRNWTLDSAEFRSRTAENSSVQHLLDDSTETWWCCTQPTNAWVIFDLKQHHRINGVRLTGCGHYSTPRNGHVDVSNAVTGPWLNVKEFTCPFARGNHHDFFFPSLETRFVRIFIKDNYGGDDIQVQRIAFFGVDMRLVHLLREHGLENSLNTLLAKGINDQETLGDNRDAILNSSEKYLQVNDHFQFVHLTASLKSPQLTFLKWFIPPQGTVSAGAKLRTFSVEGDEDVTDRVKLEERLESSSYARTILLKDLEPTHGRSLVDFSDYIIQFPGRYSIRIVSVDHPQIHTSWQKIVVGPTLSHSLKLSAATDEHFHPTSTTRLLHTTTSDKENTSFSLQKSTTSEDKRENRVFIAQVCESEEDDTEDDTDDDTYLTSLQTIEDPPYYFHVATMSYPSSNQQMMPTKERIDVRHLPTSPNRYDRDGQRTDSDDNNNNGGHTSGNYSQRADGTSPSNGFHAERQPKSGGGYQEQPNSDQGLGHGEKFLIPTKYQLRESRRQEIQQQKASNRSHGQPTPSKLTSTSERQSLSPGLPNGQKNGTRPVGNRKAEKRQSQSPKQSGRTSSSSDFDKNHNGSNQVRKASPGERSDTKKKGLPSESPKGRSRRTSSPSVSPRSPTREDANGERSRSIDNQYEIISDRFKLVKSPAGNHSRSQDPKNTQTELTFTATLQSDVGQELAKHFEQTSRSKQSHPKAPNNADNGYDNNGSSRNGRNQSGTAYNPDRNDQKSQRDPKSKDPSSSKQSGSQSPAIAYKKSADEDDNRARNRAPLKSSDSRRDRQPPTASTKDPAASGPSNSNTYRFEKKKENEVSDGDAGSEEGDCVTFGHGKHIKTPADSQSKRTRNTPGSPPFRQETDATTSTDERLRTDREKNQDSHYATPGGHSARNSSRQYDISSRQPNRDRGNYGGDDYSDDDERKGGRPYVNNHSSQPTTLRKAVPGFDNDRRDDPRENQDSFYPTPGDRNPRNDSRQYDAPRNQQNRSQGKYDDDDYSDDDERKGGRPHINHPSSQSSTLRKGVPGFDNDRRAGQGSKSVKSNGQDGQNGRYDNGYSDSRV